MPRLTPCLFALVVALSINVQLPAKGTHMRSDDRYDPQHIDDLPPEIRQRILKLCAAPKALHEFARYIDHLRKVVLHFEDLYCEGKPFCRATGCFHQVYVLSAGHYRLIRSFTAPEAN